jgi:hypothetical protein
VAFCDGTIALATLKHKRPALRLGRRHFHIRPRHTARVTIKLSAKALRTLRGRRSAKIFVEVG